jgi:hypothetical protein
MRTSALVIAAALLAAPASSFAQGVQIGPGGVHIGVGPGPVGVSPHECEELRRSCTHKDELGEQGEGNCRRYRESCR